MTGILFQRMLESACCDFAKVIKHVDNYHILNHLLGKGQFSEVFKAVKANNSKRFFAVKVIPLTREQQYHNYQNLLKQEVDILKKVQHENLVCLHDLKQTPNNLYLILDFCDGGDLRNHLSQNGKPLSEAVALTFFRQLCAGYKALYEAKVIHRDLKPENIFLHEGKVKIGDFGFARGVQDTDEVMRMTLKCSPLYATPQLLMNEGYSSKCDVWSMGCILFEMIFGFPPFNAFSIFSLVENIKAKVANGPYRLPSSINPLSPDVAQLIQSMLMFEEKKRYSWEQVFAHPAVNLTIRNNRAMTTTQIHQEEQVISLPPASLEQKIHTISSVPPLQQYLFVLNPKSSKQEEESIFQGSEQEENTFAQLMKVEEKWQPSMQVSNRCSRSVEREEKGKLRSGSSSIIKQRADSTESRSEQMTPSFSRVTAAGIKREPFMQRSDSSKREQRSGADIVTEPFAMLQRSTTSSSKPSLKTLCQQSQERNNNFRLQPSSSSAVSSKENRNDLNIIRGIPLPPPPKNRSPDSKMNGQRQATPSSRRSSPVSKTNILSQSTVHVNAVPSSRFHSSSVHQLTPKIVKLNPIKFKSDINQRESNQNKQQHVDYSFHRLPQQLQPYQQQPHLQPQPPSPSQQPSQILDFHNPADVSPSPLQSTRNKQINSTSSSQMLAFNATTTTVDDRLTSPPQKKCIAVTQIDSFFNFMRQRALFAHSALLSFWSHIQTTTTSSSSSALSQQTPENITLLILVSFYYQGLDFLRRILCFEYPEQKLIKKDAFREYIISQEYQKTKLLIEKESQQAKDLFDDVSPVLIKEISSNSTAVFPHFDEVIRLVRSESLKPEELRNRATPFIKTIVDNADIDRTSKYSLLALHKLQVFIHIEDYIPTKLYKTFDYSKFFDEQFNQPSLQQLRKAIQSLSHAQTNQ